MMKELDPCRPPSPALSESSDPGSMSQRQVGAAGSVVLPGSLHAFVYGLVREEQMADKVEKCGGRTISYPSTCTYTCHCPAGNSPCTWTVDCDGTIFTGTGLSSAGHAPKSPHVTLAGSLKVCAKILEKAWNRRITVPAKLRRVTIRRRTLRGTPEKIAEALGLQLGPKRSKGKTRRPKKDSVSIKI
jgi:hypothetical protein